MTKALIVEDNPLNMELIFEILENEGFSADMADNGEEALQKVDRVDFGLILMDIELPGIDGIEVTRIIKKKNKSIPIIALTSYAMKGDRERFLAAGFDEYVSKPIDVPDFTQRLRKYK